MKDFIKKLPKAELHLHIEGSLEPELMMKLADRNKVVLKYKSVEEIRQAYEFHDLQSFLDIYYAGAQVLRTSEDFYDLTLAYFQTCHRDYVVHSEIFFDPQTHLERGVPFEAILTGIDQACMEAKTKFGVTSELIMCFLRHLSEESAMQVLDLALPHKAKIIAVGLDSSEVGNPPSKFQKVFAKARAAGFRAVAHAGEEGPPVYIDEAIDVLKVERIDHGVRCLENPALVVRLKELHMPLTVCPLSNVKLKVVQSIEDHPLRNLIAAGLNVTLNSDDPAYFGGYINDNYLACCHAFALSKDEVKSLAANSIKASFLSEQKKAGFLSEIQLL